MVPHLGHALPGFTAMGVAVTVGSAGLTVTGGPTAARSGVWAFVKRARDWLMLLFFTFTNTSLICCELTRTGLDALDPRVIKL